MEESEKSKKQRLQELEATRRGENKKEIIELLEKIGDYTFNLDTYIKTINTEVSFEISIKGSEEE